MKIETSYYANEQAFLESSLNHDHTYLIFVAEDSPLTLEAFNKKAIRYYGAVFPKLIFNSEVLDTGLLVIELDKTAQINFIKKMNEPNFEALNFKTSASMITIMDAFSLSTTSFLEALFEATTVNTNIIGAGAGCFNEPTRKMIFSNEGYFDNAALLIGLELSLDIAVSHGWEVVDGPFLVTKSEGKTLKGIDFREAMDVYKEIVEKDSKEILDDHSQADLFKRYPLGIVKYNDAPVLRDPLAVNENNELILAGELPQNSVITLLKSTKESLLNESLKASLKAVNNKNNTLMMFECISRLEYLDGLSDNQLAQIKTHAKVESIHGVVSIGEIANTGNHYINFLNKSCVMGGLCL